MEKTWEKPTETRGNESLWSYHVTSQHFKKKTLKFSGCIFLHCSFWSKDSSYSNGNKAPWDLKWMDLVTFLEGWVFDPLAEVLSQGYPACDYFKWFFVDLQNEMTHTPSDNNIGLLCNTISNKYK